MSVDAELRAIAEKSAQQYPDSLITQQGWTRDELVDAIHARLRTKYLEMRASGELVADGDVIRPARTRKPSRRDRRKAPRTPVAERNPRCPTPTKLAFTDRYHAERTLRHWNYDNAPARPTRAYLCACGFYHLTSKEKRP